MWGPLKDGENEFVELHLQDIPYLPFSKLDRFGRPIDWTLDANSLLQQQSTQSQQPSSYQTYQQNAAAALVSENSAFLYVHDADESSFLTVDRSASGTGSQQITSAQSGSSIAVPIVTRASFARNRGSTGAAGSTASGSRQIRSRQQQASSTQSFTGSKQQQQQQQQQGRSTFHHGQQHHHYHRGGRDIAVKVDPVWQMLEEYQLNAFTKLAGEFSPPVDIASIGRCRQYNREFDRTTARSAVTLPPQPSKNGAPDYVKSTSSADEHIQLMAGQESQAPNGRKLRRGDYVFATAQVLAALMTAPRSVNGWDIIVRKVTRKDGSRVLYFDKRKNGPLDIESVQETSSPQSQQTSPAPAEGPNSISALAEEATQVSRLYPLAVLAKNKPVIDISPSPQSENSELPTARGHRYRAWNLRSAAKPKLYQKKSEEEDEDEDLNETPLTLIVCGDVDATLPGEKDKNDVQLLSLNAVTEHYPIDPATGQINRSHIDWKTKIDTMRGAITTNEMRNNAWKIARWTVECLLTGIDLMKLGFVARKNAMNPAMGHLILVTQQYRPTDFAQQLNIDLHNCWGIIKSLVEVFLNRSEPDGVYVLIKDSTQPKVKLYLVPKGCAVAGYGDE